MQPFRKPSTIPAAILSKLSRPSASYPPAPSFASFEKPSPKPMESISAGHKSINAGHKIIDADHQTFKPDHLLTHRLGICDYITNILRHITPSMDQLLRSNICRSPAAEAVFSHIVEKRGLESKFKIDSAGTIGYHEGNPADSRMRVAANKRGIKVTSISRPVRQSDFIDFDLIIAMDKQNKDDLLSSLERWSHKERFPENAYKKVKLLCSFCKKCSENEVPDPYYGGPEGFEKVLDILEDGCEVLLDNILAENK